MPDDLNVIKRLLPQRNDRPEAGSENHKLERSYGDVMEASGYTRISGADMATLIGHADKAALLACADTLSPDPYADGNRKRGLSYRLFDPRAGKLMRDPVFCGGGGTYTEYYQSPELNSDQGGRTRRFTALPEQLLDSELLERTVSLLFRLLPYGVDTKLLWLVGVHLIRLHSDGQRACLPSPNRIHCDGEYYTAITLVDRVNVTAASARNFVTRRHTAAADLHINELPDEDILWQGTLTESLETLFTDDARVAHGVTGVLGAGAHPGWRTSMLIDFSPLLLGRTPPPRCK